MTKPCRRGASRHLLLLALVAAAPLAAQAQTGGVGIGTTAPAASAALDVSSTTKGLLPPRLSQAQRDAIASPAAGLTIYNTTTGKLNTWNGTSWDAALSSNEQPLAGMTVTFSYTGAPQTYTVPAGVTSLVVDAAGAGGGRGPNSPSPSGPGARVQATLAVTPGEVLTLYVGGAGGSGGAGGYNGGGNGSFDVSQGGGGGGASDVRRSATAPSTALAERLLVAGGGGGGGGAGYTSAGGGGGGGAPNGLDGGSDRGSNGLGATQTAGGSPGGTLGQGGAASSAAGGGGGGYYGGGGGGFTAGGGGGSSWVTSTGSSGVAMTANQQAGDGVIVVTGLEYAAPVLDGSNFVNVPGDNLGNHTATRNLNLGNNALVGTGGNIGTTVGVGVRADGGLNIGQNTAGRNFFLGYAAGLATTTGIQNQFIGYAAGSNNTTGADNLFSGYASGNSNASGNANTFVGTGSGNGNTSGSNNYFGGYASGYINTIGNNNTFAGAGSGQYNTTGSNNTAFGGNSGPASGSGAISNATALGAGVTLTTSNTVVLGNGANVGIGIDNPSARLHVAGGVKINGANTLEFGAGVLGKEVNAGKIGYRAFSNDALDIIGAGTGSNRVVRVFAESGLGVTGPVNAQSFNNNSDVRFKTHVRPIGSALASVLALRGVRYDWNALGVQHGGKAGAPQVGLIAQELERLYPELVSTDAQGFKAVNYAQLTPVLIEALKEQQAQIEALKTQNAALKAETTATTEAFEARLRRLEAASGQAQR